jgi:nitrogen fixation NifU-like protein
MTDLSELYQEVILDHNRSPRNFAKPEHTNRTSEGHNPLCGDEVTIHLDVEDGVIKDVGFVGSGCAISKASASVMTTLVKGRTVEEADALFERFHSLVTQGATDDTVDLGHLAVFAGVHEYPSRVKCAALAWHTMRAALHDASKVVSTE